MKKEPFISRILLLLALCVLLTACCFSFSIAESSNEAPKLKLEIKFEGNLLFSKYKVKLKLDGKQITLMDHGKDYSGTQMVSAGNHVITFVKEDDDKVTGRAEVFVEGETTFSCTISTTRDAVNVTGINVTSVPVGKINARTKPLSTTFFGRYEQDKKEENGTEPIEWYIVEEDGKALLISTKTLDNQKYNTSEVETTWETSNIRKWLNGTFLSAAFTPDEQEAILTSTLDNMQAEKNGEWEKTEAAATEDKIFLLSYNEYLKYLQLDEEKDCPATDFANSQGSNWRIWLRSPGKNRKEMQFYSGNSYDSDSVTNSNAVRPALWIDLQADRSTFSYERFQAAEALANKDSFKEAAEIYESLGDYSNSAAKALECRYQQAIQMHENGDNPGAISLLETIRDYRDSNALILDYRYSIAVDYVNNGDYSTALSLLTEVGQYKQTMDYIRTCFDNLHVQYSWLTRKIGSSLNAGHDTGYAKRDNIKDNDPHYGWSLGRFLMSGFTEVKEDGTIPVFLKTPGDNVTLWFDLSQDIDKLNGDDGLKINHDNNGKDAEFQYPQTDFGRGALLIRHIDFRGSDSDTQIYTDYLAAKNGTGANTIVKINEEGIYEVALDYEVVKGGLIPGYNDYRIYTTFEVRNGSGMFFMFDVSTGTELEDYSRTADGFRIDLANSHSLSVNYTRYAMNQEETGLDVRKTGPASDGDTFEKVGYYVITVTNKETGEQLTKHIFVGRAADLQDYQGVDDSLSKFSN